MITFIFRFTELVCVLSAIGLVACSLLLWLRNRQVSLQVPAADFAKVSPLPPRDQLFASLDHFIEAVDVSEDKNFKKSSFSQMLWKDYESFKLKKGI
jgi:hypothetical protein